MNVKTTIGALALGAAMLAGCESYEAGRVPAGGTSTTTVVRDAYGNPVAGGTTVRDGYGRAVANAPGYPAQPGYAQPGYGQPAYPNQPVYSGSSNPPPAYQTPSDCRATPLHQDRPGGSDYNPYRGAPSC